MKIQIYLPDILQFIRISSNKHLQILPINAIDHKTEQIVEQNKLCLHDEFS